MRSGSSSVPHTCVSFLHLSHLNSRLSDTEQRNEHERAPTLRGGGGGHFELVAGLFPSSKSTSLCTQSGVPWMTNWKSLSSSLHSLSGHSVFPIHPRSLAQLGSCAEERLVRRWHEEARMVPHSLAAASEASLCPYRHVALRCLRFSNGLNHPPTGRTGR